MPSPTLPIVQQFEQPTYYNNERWMKDGLPETTLMIISISLSLSLNFFLSYFFLPWRDRKIPAAVEWFNLTLGRYRPSWSFGSSRVLHLQKVTFLFGLRPTTKKNRWFWIFFFLYFFFNLVINKHLISCGTFHSSWSVTYFDCLQQQEKIV